ncbi:PRC-barrel domain containing protein [Halobium palmae]|uniref:PRC-barrel domain containing protein n=1 Tax=Halobium palmae TaxID=1776492 RepID=A0ABD5S3K4_9EURY
MAVNIDFSDADEGKKVVDARGETVGRVIEVRHGTAYVDPDPSLGDTITSKLGWADTDGDEYPLQKATVAEITDDEVRLSGL